MTSQVEEWIQFLDEHWTTVMAGHIAGQNLSNTADESLRKLEELRLAYHEELARMTLDQLIAAVLQVMYEQDRARPFHRIGTEADFGHFGRCAFLTADEAAALSLGKDPRFVNWLSVQPYLGKSPFAFEYAKRLDLLERAIVWQELPERFSPLQFLTWAHKYKVPVPEALIQCTFVRGEPIHYWHDLCDSLAGRLSSAEADLESSKEVIAQLQEENDAEAQRTFDEWLANQESLELLTAEHENEIRALNDELASTRHENTLLRQELEAPAPESEDASISTTERKSLLTIAIAIAIDGLGYDPRDNRSPIPKQVVDAAQLVGLRLTDDTVRKYLKEATRLKGFVAPEERAKKPNSGTVKPKSV